MTLFLPSPKTASIFLLATAGSIYGLFETLTSLSDTDTFLGNPFLSLQPSTEDASVLEVQPDPIQKTEPVPFPAPPTPVQTTVDSSGSSPKATIPSPSVTVEVGLENISTGDVVTNVPQTPSQGTATKNTTKIEKPEAKPTMQSVVVSVSTKPVQKPSAKPAPKSRATNVSKTTSPKVATKPAVASSSSTKKSIPLSLSQLENYYWGKTATPKSKQSINYNGEDEYDVDEMKARFGRSSYNAIWIQYIDYMLLAPNKSNVWKLQAQQMKHAIGNSEFVQYFNPVEQTLNIPLFGRFYLPDRYPLKDGRKHPTDPYMVPWTGENLAKACKSLTEWTPTGAYLMTAREEIWHAAWNFCVKPSKIAKGEKPKGWWYQ